MALIKPVTRVFGKSGLWGGALCIYEFTHTGPSRSGEATISVVLCPIEDVYYDEQIVTVVYAHHEGAGSYTLKDFREWAVADYQENNPEWAADARAILVIVEEIVENYRNNKL